MRVPRRRGPRSALKRRRERKEPFLPSRGEWKAYLFLAVFLAAFLAFLAGFLAAFLVDFLAVFFAGMFAPFIP